LYISCRFVDLLLLSVHPDYNAAIPKQRLEPMSDPVEDTRGQSPEDRRGLPLAPRPEFAPGETVPGLSSWVLERRLGGGGFGEVWLARHVLGKEKPRAVKFCTEPAARHRLVTHEKNVVVRVMKYAGDHPNIVPLCDFNLDGEIPWLMYEFVEGGTLASLIREWATLPMPKRLGKAVRTLHAIASALATCHRLDPPLVHRDMKPQNVLMAEGKVPRITDFGIGGVVMVTEDPNVTGGMTALAARLPSVLQNAGTRNYAPAEQLFGSPPNPRDDVYALGIIAYQMVKGDLTTAPGPDANLELNDQRIPSELASLIVRSVAINPARRPKDAAEWESTLAAIIEKEWKESDTTDTSGAISKIVLLSESTDRPRARGEQQLSRGLEKYERRKERSAKRRYPRRRLAVGVLLVAVVIGFIVIAVKKFGTSQNSPGDTCEVEMAPGVKMTFCWIPPGTATLGSPDGEARRGTAGTGETQHKYLCKGFWMGKYEVTQAEWKAVMGENPSWFRVGGGGEDKLGTITDTSKFPVENVNWDMISAKGGFLDKANAHGGIQKAFGNPGKFRLPNEDEWEYACRGGGNNEKPFYWGKSLNGIEANCNGFFPYGIDVKGPYLQRTCAVDFTNGSKYPKHPWGLMHMHGNVWEWCDNRVRRGGAWQYDPVYCRAAYRNRTAPGDRYNDYGFRVCFQLD